MGGSNEFKREREGKSGEWQICKRERGKQARVRNEGGET